MKLKMTEDVRTKNLSPSTDKPIILSFITISGPGDGVEMVIGSRQPEKFYRRVQINSKPSCQPTPMPWKA